MSFFLIPTFYILHSTSYFSHPTSYILCLTSYLLHTTSYSLHLTSDLCNVAGSRAPSASSRASRAVSTCTRRRTWRAPPSQVQGECNKDSNLGNVGDPRPSASHEGASVPASCNEGRCSAARLCSHSPLTVARSSSAFSRSLPAGTRIFGMFAHGELGPSSFSGFTSAGGAESAKIAHEQHSMTSILAVLTSQEAAASAAKEEV